MMRAIKNGFTLVELVGVLTIIGVLAVVAIPRFFDRSTFESRAFSDEVTAFLRYAQKAAIAQRRTVCVSFSAKNIAPATITLTVSSAFGGACGPALIGPNGSNTIKAQDGISFGALTPDVTVNSFTPLGQPAFGQTIQVNGLSNAITIEQETGYVH